MRKFKVLFIMAAIALGIGGAFATKPTLACQDQPQFFKWGTVYVAAGTYGANYHCAGNVGVCTYFRPNPAEPNTYLPCRTGSFRFGPE